jgi:hypothetical protein
MYDSPRWMHVSAADRPPGPEPTIATSNVFGEHVLDDDAAQVRRALDERFAGDLADQVLTGNGGLKVLIDLGDFERRRHAALGKHDERFGRAREHARLALDAVLEAQHAALVRDEIEHVGRADRHARVAAGAAIVVDVVDQHARAHDRRRRDVRLVAPTGGEHRERRHQQDSEAPECQRHDPGHAITLPQILRA